MDSQRNEEASAGRLAYRQCQSLPMTWIHETPALLEKAAKLKARYPISLADAWIAAAALLEQADLVHKDPGFEVIAVSQQYRIQTLGYTHLTRGCQSSWNQNCLLPSGWGRCR